MKKSDLRSQSSFVKQKFIARQCPDAHGFNKDIGRNINDSFVIRDVNAKPPLRVLIIWSLVCSHLNLELFSYNIKTFFVLLVFVSTTLSSMVSVETHNIAVTLCELSNFDSGKYFVSTIVISNLHAK